ncbi:ABC-type transport auxiliary lipoprotein family protein [Pseudomonas sp. SA3-5]|uniref:ABC-type transport auxiliary lipoprotein family protein n=1 Tax=Pseudomonas aestuarii TaxID=3018340 RepID=A0ABT4X9D8_9PSED|nr:ABC-type transport auxiliary lipoprotein family protein [Pseudomonas aestuarii]MDA7084949.1 ABC-type transport auxiliary lipoprotein family protein [Pseudomonas aestuarii]
MRLLRFSPPLLLLAALTLSGCAALQSPTQFYRLEQGNPALPHNDKGPALLLGPLKLADYLQRENLVQRELDDSLTLTQKIRWAGSLQDDVGQLLLRQLAGQLDTSRVALYPDRVGFSSEVQVVLSISRLDSGVQQPAVLEAQWRLLDAAGVQRSSRVVRLQAKHTGAVIDQVRAQSALLQQLAGELASAIRSMPVAQAVAPRKPVVAAPAKRPEKKPLTPLLEPAKQVEVFRF